MIKAMFICIDNYRQFLPYLSPRASEPVEGKINDVIYVLFWLDLTIPFNSRTISIHIGNAWNETEN